MSEGETFMMVVSIATNLVLWGRWYRAQFCVVPLRRRRSSRWLGYFVPFLAGLIIWVVLKTLASHDVRDDAQYVCLYLFMGAAWTAFAQLLFGVCGISWRDDVLERDNPAASFALCGAILGVALCFAGANIGDGPGWWVVVFCALLSTVGFFVIWVLLGAFTGLAESVTVERDVPTGLRCGGYLLATGLILGRAVAGDWTSAGSTVVDFARAGWPAVLLIPVAVPLERAFRPSPSQPQTSMLFGGMIPALFAVAAAAAYLLFLGPCA